MPLSPELLGVRRFARGCFQNPKCWGYPFNHVCSLSFLFLSCRARAPARISLQSTERLWQRWERGAESQGSGRARSLVPRPRGLFACSRRILLPFYWGQCSAAAGLPIFFFWVLLGSPRPSTALGVPTAPLGCSSGGVQDGTTVVSSPALLLPGVRSNARDS